MGAECRTSVTSTSLLIKTGHSVLCSWPFRNRSWDGGGRFHTMGSPLPEYCPPNIETFCVWGMFVNAFWGLQGYPPPLSSPHFILASETLKVVPVGGHSNP